MYYGGQGLEWYPAKSTPSFSLSFCQQSSLLSFEPTSCSDLPTPSVHSLAVWVPLIEHFDRRAQEHTHSTETQAHTPIRTLTICAETVQIYTVQCRYESPGLSVTCCQSRFHVPIRMYNAKLCCEVARLRHSYHKPKWCNPLQYYCTVHVPDCSLMLPYLKGYQGAKS